MRLFPVALDFRPPYLAGSPSDNSLLLLPLGQATFLEYLQASFSEVTGNPPIVMTTFAPSAAYEAAIRRACPTVEAILPVADLGGRLDGYQPSDWLLITDSRQLPINGLDLKGLVTNLDSASRWVRHLVTLEATLAGTQECVQFDAAGRVSRIQRYYEDVTWPFASGVTCSLVPVACTQRAGNLPFHSLRDLRTSLAAQGVASRDAPITGGTFDLSVEQGADYLIGREAHDSDVVRIDMGSRQIDVEEELRRGAQGETDSLAPQIVRRRDPSVFPRDDQLGCPVDLANRGQDGKGIAVEGSAGDRRVRRRCEIHFSRQRGGERQVPRRVGPEGRVEPLLLKIPLLPGDVERGGSGPGRHANRDRPRLFRGDLFLFGAAPEDSGKQKAEKGQEPGCCLSQAGLSSALFSTGPRAALPLKPDAGFPGGRGCGWTHIVTQGAENRKQGSA
jgi:hypothetical protein